MAGDDRLTTLYEWSETMSQAGDKVKEKHENDYKTMIDYVKTSETKERILAAQLIARFFKHFPEYEEPAFDAIVDLCESANVVVRKHATMAMIAICRDCKNLVSKAADILIQLYQTNQASEVNLINQSLTTLLNLDVEKFLQSFFTNFEDGTEIVRERALKFLSTKIFSVGDGLTKDIEKQILDYAKKAMEDVTKDEFITFINILTKLKISKTADGQSNIVAIIKSQAELEKEFDIKDSSSLDKLLLCTKLTMPLFSQYNRSTDYVNYICIHILPHLKELSSQNSNDLNVLQYLAEMSPHIGPLEKNEGFDIEKCQSLLYSKLVEFLPLPVIESEKTNIQSNDSKEATDEDANEENKAASAPEPDTKVVTDDSSQVRNQDVDFQFTHIEYLLYTFQQFGRLKPEFFDETRQNSIKIRLQHLAIGCTKYMQILTAQLRNVKGDDLKKDENRIRSVALQTTKNISTMVKDLFKKPVQFKAEITLSCKLQTVGRFNGTGKRQAFDVAANQPAPKKRVHN